MMPKTTSYFSCWLQLQRISACLAKFSWFRSPEHVNNKTRLGEEMTAHDSQTY